MTISVFRQTYELIKTISNLTTPEWHQLLVIGNGFDLFCGLKSRFPEFFERRLPLIFCDVQTLSDKGYNSWGEYLAANHLTAWDIILKDQQHIWWHDVESAIEGWIVPKANDYNLRITRILSCLNPNKVAWCLADNAPFDWMEYTGKPCKSYPESDVARYIAESKPSFKPAEGWDEHSILAVLLEDLHSLEKEFGNYLIEITEGNLDYSLRAVDLMRTIVNDERADKDAFDVQDSILSFNYTRPIDVRDSSGFDIAQINVHGRLGDEIVFGIDGTGRMALPDVAPFTKTYRVMSLRTPDSGGLIHSSAVIGDGSCTSIIKFFGHSLSKADYSYFQSLFDSINLYAGATRIIFYYAPYGDGMTPDEQLEHAKRETMSNVVQLLTAYGKTFDNKDHGKNLIHKLLIEGRLSVKPLPEVSDKWRTGEKKNRA